MAQRFYLAEHEEQRNTGAMSGTNCAAASGSILVDQWSLDLKDPQVRRFRKLTDDTEGGLRAGQIAAVMEEDFGMKVRLYDYRDNLKWPTLRSYLNRGWFACVAGDNDVLPPAIKAKQRTDYDGFHMVVYHQRFKGNQRVGDPLQKDWAKWPHDLAYQYVRKFDRQTQGGIHAVVMVPQFAKLRVGIVEANIYAAPTKTSKVLKTMKQGQRYVTGGVLKGDAIAGVRQWRRLWVPSHARFGYIHWTQTWS